MDPTVVIAWIGLGVAGVNAIALIIVAAISHRIRKDVAEVHTLANSLATRAEAGAKAQGELEGRAAQASGNGKRTVTPP